MISLIFFFCDQQILEECNLIQNQLLPAAITHEIQNVPLNPILFFTVETQDENMRPETNVTNGIIATYSDDSLSV